MTCWPEPLPTPRLVLRTPRQHDVARVVRELSNWSVVRWLTRVPYPFVPRHARVWLDTVVNDGDRRCERNFAIARRERPDCLIGMLSWHNLDQPRPSVGYWLAQSAWGKGYALEALTASLDWVEAWHPQAQPTATVLPGNHRSIGVLKKAGFRRQIARDMHASRALQRKVAVVRFTLVPGRRQAAAPDIAGHLVA